MLSKKESKDIERIIKNRGITIGSILQRKGVLEFLIVLGVTSYVDKRLVVLKYDKELPSDYLIARDIENLKFERVAIEYLENFEVKGILPIDAHEIIQFVNEFKSTLNEAKIVSKLKVGSILSVLDWQTFVVVNMNPFEWVILYGKIEDKNIIENTLKNRNLKIRNAEEQWYLKRNNVTYVTEISETTIMKLRLMGNIYVR